MGGSGSGKSTISSLIGGFYSVTNGEVLLDGVNVNDLTGDFIRSMVSIVPQEPGAVFGDDSVEHHLRVGGGGGAEEVRRSTAQSSSSARWWRR